MTKGGDEGMRPPRVRPRQLSPQQHITEDVETMGLGRQSSLLSMVTVYRCHTEEYETMDLAYQRLLLSIVQVYRCQVACVTTRYSKHRSVEDQAPSRWR